MRKKTIEEFINESSLLHNNKYNYSESIYNGNREKIIIKCPIHGAFFQTPVNHLKGCGCPHCAGVALSDTATFIEKAKNVHGNKYDYSNTIYTNVKTKISVICPVHGTFEQSPRHHLRGQGCSKCSGNNKKTNEEFISEIIKVHGDRYDYSKVKYKGAKYKIKIICREHGEFEQVASSHLTGNGCNNCGNDLTKKKLRHTTEVFITNAKIKHNNLYDYSKVSYLNNRKKVEIICEKHGSFYQTPDGHIKGQGCPKCVHHISKSEIELQNYIKSLGYNIITNVWGVIKRKEIDIYIPELNKAIEFNGEWWHYSDKHFEKGKHSTKSNLCKDEGIKLLHVREKLWVNEKEKMKNVIKQFLK